jgi:hypothetical protein
MRLDTLSGLAPAKALARPAGAPRLADGLGLLESAHAP